LKKILLVDDDEDLAVIVSHVLKSNGFDVRTHLTGLKVSDVVEHYNPHLILLDQRLYGESGTDICRELKRSYHIPIILCSGDNVKGEESANYGADGFLPKPFSIDELLTTIDFFLEHRKADTHKNLK
jgi:DNA-binding response OmpR family regulator